MSEPINFRGAEIATEHAIKMKALKEQKKMLEQAEKEMIKHAHNNNKKLIEKKETDIKRKRKPKNVINGLVAKLLITALAVNGLVSLANEIKDRAVDSINQTEGYAIISEYVRESYGNTTEEGIKDYYPDGLIVSSSGNYYNCQDGIPQEITGEDVKNTYLNFYTKKGEPEEVALIMATNKMGIELEESEKKATENAAENAFWTEQKRGTTNYEQGIFEFDNNGNIKNSGIVKAEYEAMKENVLDTNSSKGKGR